MADDSGFGPAESDVIDASALGGEGDVASPRAPFERSPAKVLASLSDTPLEQAVKAIEYLRGLDKRKAALLKTCSPQALNLIAQNGPEYLATVQAVA